MKNSAKKNNDVEEITLQTRNGDDVTIPGLDVCETDEQWIFTVDKNTKTKKALKGKSEMVVSMGQAAYLADSKLWIHFSMGMMPDREPKSAKGNKRAERMLRAENDNLKARLEKLEKMMSKKK